MQQTGNKILGFLAILFIFVVIFSVVGVCLYTSNIKAVSKKSKEVVFEVKENQTYSTLGSELEKQGLIKSNFFYKIYIKLNSPKNLQKGVYVLNKNMDLKEIIEIFEDGSNSSDNYINITFKEGLNIRKIAKVISENTDNSYDDVINVMSDKEYINSLINEYWFLTNDILNENIYYPLEGYLFPETYQIGKDYKVKDILKVMLNQTDKVLKPYKETIEKSSYSVHQIMTMSSIVELEAGNANDRAGVSGVFYNRLRNGWTLGSDVTTYYGSKIDDFKISLTYKELNDCSNKYNTRCASFAGLPVGPICNPGSESIIASINPSSHNYYYFVADCSGKTYMNTNSQGHANIINQLKNENNWCA